MVVFTSFKELNSYIVKRFGKPVNLSYVEDKELRITYTQRILIKDVNVNLNIHIDKVNPDSLSVTYKGGMALDMMIKGAISYFREKLPELSEGIIPEDNHRILIDFKKIKKAKGIVEKISLRDIHIEKEGIRIELALKA